MKTYVFKNLVRGMAPVLGTFIRSSWLLNNKRFAVVGFSLNDLTLYDCIPESTTPLSDIHLLFASEYYKINPTALNQSNVEKFTDDMGNTIYCVTIIKNDNVLRNTDLDPYLQFEEIPELFRTLKPIRITLKLFIREVQAPITDEISKAQFAQLFQNTDQIIAVPARNESKAVVTSKYRQHGLNEDLEITFNGDEEDRLQFENCISGLMTLYAEHFK